MTRKAQAIAEQFAALSKKQRAEVALLLLQGLEREHEETADEIESAWTEEVERRLAGVKSRTTRLVDGEQVLREARGRCK